MEKFIARLIELKYTKVQKQQSLTGRLDALESLIAAALRNHN